MIRVFTDFNAMTTDEVCWILKYNGTNLDKQIDTLKLQRGDKIILYQDIDDFDVIAILDFRYVDILGREAWIAVPDWSTILRK